MKKYLMILLIMIFVTPAYSEDDDSTPYMPYLEQPKQEAPAKKQVKKTTTKKKTQKSAPKKKTPAKKVSKPTPPARPSSLQQGINLINEGRYEAAKNYLLKAIQENRNDPNVWYWYGVYHEKTGGFHQAQYFYSKAVTIDPAFDPLSRVVYYPNDAEKTPLWDPKRPARVYPVETANDGIAITSQYNYPSSPNDPSLPKVPIYIPPEPDASPSDGDSWSPAIYVPPTPQEGEFLQNGERAPIYVPPEAAAVVADTRVIPENYNYVEIPGYSVTYNTESVNYELDDVRADLPLYNPPAPGEMVVKIPTSAPADRSVTKVQPKQAAKQTNTAKAKTEPKQQNAPRKIVKQSEKKKSKSTKQKISSDVKPSQPKQKKETPMPIVPEVKQETTTKPETKQNEYLPPVGQFAPDPGTINNDERMMPPVGQNNN